MSCYNLSVMLRFRVIKKLHLSGIASAKTVADLSLSRMGSSNEFIIPGSTIKGVLRTCMIRISKLFNYSVRNFSVYPEMIHDDDIITSLMGRPNGYRSKVIVSPAVFTAPNTIILSHVSIDDVTGTAREGNLFKIEYLPPGVEFSSVIEAHNITQEEARLLFLAIVEMNYERFGRGGIVEVSIVKNSSVIPDEIAKDPVIKEVLLCKSI